MPRFNGTGRGLLLYKKPKGETRGEKQTEIHGENKVCDAGRIREEMIGY